MTDYFSGKCPLFKSGLTTGNYLKINDAGTQIEDDIYPVDDTVNDAITTLNSDLASVRNNFIGTSAPATTYAGMWWIDTSTNLLKQRNAANNAWVTIGAFGSSYLGLLTLATAQSITAQHTFAPSTAQAPFALSANAQNQKVTGLYADTSASATGAETSLAGQHTNLVISNNATHADHQVDITADSFIVATSAGLTYKCVSVSLTIDMDASGANGLDTGLVDQGWYYIWVIYNPTTSTTAGVFSASATAPTLPSGFTYYGRAGAIYAGVHGNHDLITIYQKDKVCFTTEKAIVTTGTATSFTAVDLSAAIPSIARSTFGIATVTNSTDQSVTWVFIAPTSSGDGATIAGGHVSGNDGALRSEFHIPFGVSQAYGIYYKILAGATGSTNISIVGWTV